MKTIIAIVTLAAICIWAGSATIESKEDDAIATPVAVERIVSEHKIPDRVSPKDVKCLADNIYYEARGEGDEGMFAVAFVTLNRATSGLYPKKICDVVFQTSQFSWTAVKDTMRISEKEIYSRAKEIASQVLTVTHLEDVTDGSMYFHIIQMKPPTWTKELIPTVLIGNHIFYKQKEPS
jgi:spore germination cell wall hydrolase CwlJ-like protein